MENPNVKEENVKEPEVNGESTKGVKVKKPGAKGKKVKKILKIIAFILLALIIVVGGYVAYVFLSFHRIDDNQKLDIDNNIGSTVAVGEEMSMISYNIGFAAYTPDFGFFMDGGKQGKASSENSVKRTMDGISEFLEKEDADFLLLQEVDKDSTRSYHTDQAKILRDTLPGYDSIYAVNYDSPYLFYPLYDPHGKSLAGMLTLSKYNMQSAVRKSLPIEGGFMKVFDLDRCYSVSRFPVSNGKYLVLYTLHLSAYTSDGSIATEQLKILLKDMQGEYEKGNYCIAGGDFNKDLLGDSSEIFGVDGSEYSWAQPIDNSLFEGGNLNLVVPFDEDDPIPSCRNANGPYSDEQFVLTVDGFIVSDNVNVTGSNVYDLEFIYSDHNPVYMNFILEK